MSIFYRSARVLIAALLLASLIFISPGVQAAALGVTTLDDELNSDGDCSLREAIEAANTNAAVDACSAGASGSTDTITFSVSGTITLGSTLTVTNGGALVIDGGDAITVDGDDSVQVFLANTGADLTLEDLTVQKGAASDGAGLLSKGKVSIISSDFAANNATNAGGAIYNDPGGDL
jgi:CSLREA domain-containing protein